MKLNEKQIRNTMMYIMEHHRDNKTNEINHTALAEETAVMLNLYEDNIDWVIPERVFEIALDFN